VSTFFCARIFSLSGSIDSAEVILDVSVLLLQSGYIADRCILKWDNYVVR